MTEQDDALARALAELERADRAEREPAWDEVVHGRRPAADVVEQLRAQGHDEAELTRTAALMTPLSEEFEASLVERLLEVRGAEAEAEATEVDPTSAAAPEPAPAEPEAAVVQRPDRAWWQRGGTIAAGLVAAAAVLLLVLPRDPDPGPPTPSGARLPEHELWLQPSSAEVRSTRDEPVVVAPGETLSVLLRPATRYSTTPRVWACLERDSARQRVELTLGPITPGLTIEGSVVIPEGLAVGDWTLLTAIDDGAAPLPEDPCVTLGSVARVQRAPLQVSDSPR
ncbi:MAG: hypothetical protein AB1Z98_31045 [Nannocystaceae bacterium]